MEFRIDTHVHTSETSRCGRSGAQEMIGAYAQKGFGAVVITDHFVNGNSNCGRDIPWQARMDEFLLGYRAALAAGKAQKVCVLLGWEWGYHGEDYLTYGLDEAFLYAHPETEEMEPAAYCALVQACGGFVSRAHPFREAAYLKGTPPQRPLLVDGVEVINGAHLRGGHPDFDARALAQCTAYGRVQTAGSDAHHVSEAGLTGMIFPCPLHDEKALAGALREGLGRVIGNPVYAKA